MILFFDTRKIQAVAQRHQSGAFRIRRMTDVCLRFIILPTNDSPHHKDEKKKNIWRHQEPASGLLTARAGGRFRRARRSACALKKMVKTQQRSKNIKQHTRGETHTAHQHHRKNKSLSSDSFVIASPSSVVTSSFSHGSGPGRISDLELLEQHPVGSEGVRE